MTRRALAASAAVTALALALTGCVAKSEAAEAIAVDITDEHREAPDLKLAGPLHLPEELLRRDPLARESDQNQHSSPHDVQSSTCPRS